ncbi:hypothetical protein H5410_013152 [Solanum commersonii]|uniref:PB1-like domain-containing protein n=1 Tax=Solanum commersonii TaxID=4109 RepID=A0A9J6ATQ6_SOLCO|nr:hypothetical protein H5410_013152 [Solanum commersonii]
MVVLLRLEKKDIRGKPYHGGRVYEFLDVDIDRLSYFKLRDCLKELGYEPGQCVLYVKLPRSTTMLEIKSDNDTILIAECLNHGDILNCFVCHFVADPVLILPLLEYGESGVGEGASQNSRPNASFDAELEPTHEAQENASNPVPANSNTSSHVHSFTAPNTLPPTHQTPTLIHTSTNPTLDPVHHSFDPIPDPVHPSNEKDSDRESLNGEDLMREPYYPSDKAASFETDLDAFSDDEEEVQQKGRIKPRRSQKVNRVVFDASSHKVVWELGLVFESVNEFRSAVTKYVVAEHVAIEMYINEPTRIRPVMNLKMWLESQNISVIPPPVRKMPGRPGKKRKKEQGETSKTGKLSKRGVEMSCNTCHNNGHNKRKCYLGVPASGISFTAGPSSRPLSGPAYPAAAPSSRPPSGPAAAQIEDLFLALLLHQHQHKLLALLLHQYQHKLLAQEQHLMLQLEEERGSVASRTRMVGMGVLHTQSGAIIINSSVVVTGDLGHKPTCGVKWKGKQAMTSSQLEEMGGRKQMETRSKAAHLSQESSNSM